MGQCLGPGQPKWEKRHGKGLYLLGQWQLLILTQIRVAPKPSTTGGNTGNGDQGTADKIGLPVYVVTRNAIWKAVPNAKDPVKVAGKDWWKPSEKAKVKC